MYAILKTCSAQLGDAAALNVRWRHYLEIVTDIDKLGVIQEKAGPIMVEN